MISRLQRLHVWIAWVLQGVLVLGVAAALWEGLWLNAVLTSGILLLTFLPTVMRQRMRVFVPAEMEVVTIVFLFASLFLGSMRGYYYKYWWWDVVLHTSSGFLLGILGLLLVYVLNENPRIDMHMRPRFVALFAFSFAVAMGALWEVFEFGMDSFFGLDMQKSGLVDTMWDLIVDTIGAAAVALVGYQYMRGRRRSFVERWVRGFLRLNRHLFRSEPEG